MRAYQPSEEALSLEEVVEMEAITDQNFVEETKDGLVLIDFWATWCGPCRMQAPILEQLAEEVDEDELRILKMDVDENPTTAREFGIMSIPTLMFKKNGQVVKQVAGVHTKQQLLDIVKELNA
ncbi:thioredoxin [Streptococcus sp. DD13]|uniref:thioredoxin n=1 Tax=Streptococcus sp. DD13 TaxID=1777881 RepID=UPI0009EE0662|nr:thioredoxin [Streptococcus sp. DD13]